MQVNLSGESPIQSPYLFLQAAGSTGSDGSATGIHLRWDLLRNLGDEHFPKGNAATNNVGFNRPTNDHVEVMRTPYDQKFPTKIALNTAPDTINNGSYFWVYTTTNTGTVVYVHFRNTTKYDSVLGTVDPNTDPLGFVQNYCPEVMEIEVKDKLVFAIEYDLLPDGDNPFFQGELLSVVENIPFADRFVSCRQEYFGSEWCTDNCNNLLLNSGFENGNKDFNSDHTYSTGGQLGNYFVGNKASGWNASFTGTPKSGNQFLMVYGSNNHGASWYQSVPVNRQKNYCFRGWVNTLNGGNSATLMITITGLDDGKKHVCTINAPSTPGVWDDFECCWNVGVNTRVRISIENVNHKLPECAYGLDDLVFCEDTSASGNCNNLVVNPGFETTNPLGFSTTYTQNTNPGSPGPRNFWLTNNANAINSSWAGTPHSGSSFLAADGANSYTNLWEQTFIDLTVGADYCFGGWSLNMFPSGGPVFIHVLVIFPDGSTYRHEFWGPTAGNDWQNFEFTINTGSFDNVRIEIYNESVGSYGNDYGLDDLYFCEKLPSNICPVRMVSENVQTTRIATTDSYPFEFRIETYEDFIVGKNAANDWSSVGNYALTDDTNTAHTRLEDVANFTIDDQWPKFNGTATVNVQNYKDRWHKSSAPNEGLKYGVQEYITLTASGTNPGAIKTHVDLVEGNIEISLFDMLKLVSMDFHVARMLGLGHIDTNSITNDDDEYVYISQYITEGNLDDGNGARLVRHNYMSLPTARKDERLPENPTLNEVTYGLYVDNGTGTPELLTDVNGYTKDGLYRYVNLHLLEFDSNPVNGDFFNPSDIFCGPAYSNPVFVGIEYRNSGGSWVHPELSHDTNSPPYVDSNGDEETVPIPLPSDYDDPVFIHGEETNGIHDYAAYGINWFSRVNTFPTTYVSTDTTTLVKPNTLQPPSNVRAQLIQKESPLLLTTAAEQTLYDGVSGDKTLVRFTFDYTHEHDKVYDFADQVRIYFREDAPEQVNGQVTSVTAVSGSPELAQVNTSSYMQYSTGNTVTPILTAADAARFVGGILVMRNDRWVIDSINTNAGGVDPVFIVRKEKEATVVETSPGSNSYVTVTEWVGPERDPAVNEQVLFIAIENMANPATWGGASNLLSKTVTIGTGSWATQTENITEDDGSTTTLSLRGIWGNTTITDVANPNQAPNSTTGQGVYKIDFSTTLANHPQASDPDPVNWYKGVIMIHSASNPSGPRKVLEVFRIDNIGTGSNFTVYAFDPSFSSNPIQTGSGVNVNFYPGYRVYLHDESGLLDETTTLPTGDDLSRFTYFGAISQDTSLSYESAVGQPAMMLSRAFVDPIPPEGPAGPLFATKPDFYGKATYTFSMKFGHKPFGVAFYRATETALLKALYEDTTVEQIKTDLAALGEDAYFTSRWQNMINFDYTYDNSGLPYYDATGTNPNDTFRRFPREAGNYRFPKPDKAPTFDGTKEPGEIPDLLKEAIWDSFTPLTEQPLLYSYINDSTYQPVPKKQNVRDRNGDLLDTTDSDFRQAPMAKKTGGSGHEVQFTDFTLDGAATNFYFYCAREIGNQLSMSDPGPISGPILLVNAMATEAPQIKGIVTVELTTLRGTKPAVEITTNGYPSGTEQVTRLQVYRATNATDALTVRTMELAKTVDLEEEGTLTDPTLKLLDDFEGMATPPYGEALFYRVIALRKITNDQNEIEFVPSKPSKLMLTNLVDSGVPAPPAMSYSSDAPTAPPVSLNNVKLNWTKTVHNGKYYLYKRNSKGTWKKIHTVTGNNDDVIEVALSATDFGSGTLIKQDADLNTLYHGFRVEAENSSGIVNSQRNDLTL